jgi:signal transduction histidine kinase
MIVPAIPVDEKQRLHALKQYKVLDTLPEQDYDDLVQLASAICEVPISLISLIDTERQWFKAKIGIDGQETLRETAFCAHAIHHDDLMVVEDATKDARFVDNPYVVGDPDVRFYAGMPLINPEGYKLGTLCVIDKVPRKLNALQEQTLKVLSKQVIKLFEIRKKNEELSRLNELQNKMLSVIAHDVRGPLNSLQVLLEFIDPTEADSDELKEALQDAMKLVGNGRDLLENMLSWAGSMQKENGFYPETTAIAPLVDALLQAHEVKAKSKGIKLINQVPVDLQAEIDKQMLNFILRNLLTNALKFTAKGEVKVGGEAIDNGVRLFVQDTGCGIAEADLPKLMRWDQRFTTRGTQKERGAGVGLLLATEFIHRHEGELQVESQVGVGTTMHFTLLNQLG